MQPITTRSVQRAFREAADAVGLDSTISVHTLRHSFATHLLEQGVELRVIQDLLGHRQITSTTRYARVALNTIRQIQSPLELLNIEERVDLDIVWNTATVHLVTLHGVVNHLLADLDQPALPL